MKFNVSNVDRAIRWVIGLSVIAFALAYHSDLYLVGVVLVVSALVGYCPLYTILGIDTKNGAATSEVPPIPAKGRSLTPTH